MASPPFRRPLDGGLVLRSLAGPEDVERVAAFDALIHGESTAPTWRAWMTAHPGAQPDYWLFIEEQATRRVVAALCLLPWRLQYEGVELRSGEMGVVGTLEEYRRRGLQRALNERFSELLRAGGFDLSHIQGIPYFYRQFGYEYAAPLEGWWRLEHSMPLEGPEGARHSCRPATPADLPALVRLYDAAARALDLSALRDEATWRYLLGPALATETAAETWLVVDSAGAPVGYFRIARQGFGEGLIVAETSLMGADAATAALRLCRQLALERGKPYIRLNLPADSALVQVARAFGAYDTGSYAWQVRLLDPPALLRRLAPALERRLATSIFAGLTRDVHLDLYRQAIVLRFAGGRLAAVEPVPPGAWGDVRLPPQLLAPLLLGYRSFGELAAMYPDASADGRARALVDALFPKMRAFLYQQY
ncbi:MAG TPA: GNAT family N-acetyltransferase [Roseiflexaceae bacterium]|nr:GNAT family N-acetyltransferase [Roseiflexaceae bacterium]